MSDREITCEFEYKDRVGRVIMSIALAILAAFGAVYVMSSQGTVEIWGITLEGAAATVSPVLPTAAAVRPRCWRSRRMM